MAKRFTLVPGELLEQPLEDILWFNSDFGCCGDKGTIWITNYRILLSFENTVVFPRQVNEFSIAISAIYHIEKIDRPSHHCFIIKSSNFTKLIIGIIKHHPNKKKIVKLIPKIALHHSQDIKKLFCFFNTQQYEPNGWECYSIDNEQKRQAIPKDKWRIEENIKFQLSKHIPGNLIVPKEINKAELQKIAKRRFNDKLPLLTWRSIITGRIILRGSTPKKNISITEEENKFFERIVQSTPSDTIITIDLQDLINENHPNEEGNRNHVVIQIPNENQFIPLFYSIMVDHVTNSIKQYFIQHLFENLLKILDGIEIIMDYISDGHNILLQNETGDGFLSLISAVIQLYLDPYYRTVKGFCCLIDKEFLYFGHLFILTPDKKRKKNSDVFSSIFVIFLDIVWQLMIRNPISFEFDEKLLLFFIDSIHSCEFGSFITSCEFEKLEMNVPNSTPSIFSYIEENYCFFQNFYFLHIKPKNADHDSVEVEDLPPNWIPFSINDLNVWYSLYFHQNVIQFLPEAQYRISLSELIQQKKRESAQVSPNIIAKKTHHLQNENQKNDVHIDEDYDFENDFDYDKDDMLHILNLSRLNLPFFPCNDVESLTNLTTLDLSHNYLNQFPTSLLFAKNLKILLLSHNFIVDIPNEIFSLLIENYNQLIQLDISENKLQQLSSKIGELKTLKSLNIHGNQIKILPKFNSLQLIHLDIGNNPFIEFPFWIYELKTLKKLTISNYPFNEFPANFYLLHNMQSLNISRCNLYEFPEKLNHHLQSLNISFLPLKKFPEFIFNNNHLKSLSIAGLNLLNIPNQLHQLKQLELLDISYNEIEFIPNFVLSMITIESLNLSNNKISLISPMISKLVNLRKLYLQNNEITCLPYSLGLLHELYILDISNNQIHEIPFIFGNLCILKNGGLFLFDDNPIEIPSKEIYSLGNSSISSYFKEYLEGIHDDSNIVHKSNHEDDNELLFLNNNPQKHLMNIGIPIYFIVDYSAKENLSKKWKPKIFTCKNNSNLFPSNAGNITHYTCQLEIQNYNKNQFYLNCCILADQFVIMNHLIDFKNQGIYIIQWKYYDADLSELFYWLKKLKTRIFNPYFIILYTHDEKMNQHVSPANIKEQKQKISDYLCKNQFSIINLSLLSDDPSDPNHPNENFTNKLKEIILSHPHNHEKIPRKFFCLQKILIELSPYIDFPILSNKKFDQILSICNIRDHLIKKSAIQWLNENGSILYYYNYPKLNNKIFINIRCLFEVFYRLFTFTPMRAMFPHTDLVAIFHNFHNINISSGLSNEKKKIEKIKKYFYIIQSLELSALLPTSLVSKQEELALSSSSNNKEDAAAIQGFCNGTSIFPLFLPSERPLSDDLWNLFPKASAKQFTRIYKSKTFIFPDYISRMLVKIIEIYPPDIYWQNGLILRYPFTNNKQNYKLPNELLLKNNNIHPDDDSEIIYKKFSILIEIFPNRECLEITVRDNFVFELSNLIFQTIESFLDSLSFDYQISIPCIHCLYDKNYSPRIFSLNECLHAFETNKTFLPCADAEVDLISLVPYFFTVKTDQLDNIQSYDLDEITDFSLKDKQKEQKQIDLVQRSWILPHLHDSPVHCLIYLKPCKIRDYPLICSATNEGNICTWKPDGTFIQIQQNLHVQIVSMISVRDQIWVLTQDSIIHIFCANVS